MKHPETQSALTDFLDEVGPSDAFEVLAGLLPDAAVFVVDGERNVLHWSRGAEKVLGFRADEAVGRLCLSSIRCRNCMIGCGIARLGEVEDVVLQAEALRRPAVPVQLVPQALLAGPKGGVVGLGQLGPQWSQDPAVPLMSGGRLVGRLPDHGVRGLSDPHASSGVRRKNSVIGTVWTCQIQKQ